jgi:hypothetical protein
VRALLDTLDALNPMPVGATSATPRLNGTHVPREVIADLEGVGKGGGPADPAHSELVVLETELREAVAQRAALDRAVASARSRALAVFAETESTRRANGDDVPGYAGALRARLTKRGATSWVGAAPVVLDDALASCPPDQVDDARAALLDASEHAQCIYITADAALLTWAAQLAPEAGVLAQPVPR